MVWWAYFDKPDGEDCFGKIWFCTRSWATIGGLVAATDIVMLSQPQTYYAGLMRAGHFIVPFVAMGAAGAAITCSVATIRKKDDVINYIIGGFVGGSIWGATYRSLPVGVGFGVIAAAFAAGAKIAHRDNWNSFRTDIKTGKRGYFRHYQRDFTIRKDPKDVNN